MRLFKKKRSPKAKHNDDPIAISTTATTTKSSVSFVTTEIQATSTSSSSSPLSASLATPVTNNKNPFNFGSNKKKENGRSIVAAGKNPFEEPSSASSFGTTSFTAPSFSPAGTLKEILVKLQDHEQQQQRGEHFQQDELLQATTTTTASTTVKNNPFNDDFQEQGQSVSPFEDDFDVFVSSRTMNTSVKTTIENTTSIPRNSVATTASSTTAVDLDSVLDLYDVKLMCAQVVDCMLEAQDMSPETSLDIQRDGAQALYLLSLQLQNEYENGDMDEQEEEDENNDDDTADFSASVTSPGVEAILSAMEEFPDDEILQHWSCTALEIMTVWKENQEIILLNGRVEEILVALEEFVDNIDLQKAAMGILRNLACHPYASEDKAVSQQLANAIPSVLEILKDHRDDMQIYEQGCMALAEITNKNHIGQQLLSREQLGIRITIDALHKFSKQNRYPKIQLAAMNVLEHVSSHPSLECKGKIVMQGGIERIIEALQRNTITTTSISSFEDEIENDTSYDEDSHGREYKIKRKLKENQGDVSTLIIISALQTLGNITESNTSSDETIRQLGKVVKVVLNVLRQHPRNGSIQASGFRVLRFLAPVHMELLTSYGGISTILISMLEHPTDFRLHEHACGTLTNLLSSASTSENSLDLIHTISTEDGLTIIFRSVRTHQVYRSVEEQCFGALYYLSCSRDLTVGQKKQLCLEENIFVLLGTMNQYIDSEILCQRGCGLILNMSCFAPLSQDAMASVGGTRIILAAMRRHGLNVQIQEYGVGILSGFCLDDKNHAEFVNEEGIATVLAAMMIHPDQPGIQAYCCDLLFNMASSNPTYKQSIIDGNGEMVANDALMRHKAHKGVQSRGTQLIQALS